MSGGNQLCIRLSGTRPSCAMLYYGIFAAVLVLFCVWESLFTARCAAAGRQNHLLRLQADVRRYGFLIEQLVRRNLIQSIGRVSSASSGVSSIRC